MPRQRPIALLTALVLLAGCGETGGGGRLDLYLDRKGCSAPCSVDRFDLFIRRGGCLYAWRTGLAGGEQLLEDLELSDGEEATAEVLARCAGDPCVRCTARRTFRAGQGARIDLALGPAASCTATPETTTPCSRCLPGPDAYCDDRHRVSCPAAGQTQRSACPAWCVDGACSSTCAQETIFYRDADGDTYGDSAAQTRACSLPAGHAARGGDCDDTDARVHPGQTAYFSAKNKQGDFDYNCDNVEEPRYKSIESCALQGGSCVGEGWIGAVPFCGQLGFFAPCALQASLCSRALPTQRKQACR